MPIIRVRLGHTIDCRNKLFHQPELAKLLRSLRSMMVGTVTNDEKEVELEVSHDDLGFDQNIEALAIEIHIEQTAHSYEYCQEWLNQISRNVLNKIAALRVPLSVIPSFQLTLVIGGHYTGCVYQLADDGDSARRTAHWCDQSLHPNPPS